MLSKSELRTIQTWLEEMSRAAFDPSSTFSSIDVVSDFEVCKSKKRFHSTSQAILFLAKRGKQTGSLVKQIPYKCRLCRGVHNSHLISRAQLSSLQEKYVSIADKLFAPQAVQDSAQSNSGSRSIQQTWKNYDHLKLLTNLNILCRNYLFREHNFFGNKITLVSNYASELGYPSAFVIEEDPVELQILTLLFFASSYRKFLQKSVDPVVLISDKHQLNPIRKLDSFEERVFRRYFSDETIWNGIRNICQKSAGQKKLDWVRLNNLVDQMRSKAKFSEGGSGELIHFWSVEPAITKAYVRIKVGQTVDFVSIQSHLQETTDHLQIHIGILRNYLQDELLFEYEIPNLEPSTAYKVLIEVLDLHGHSQQITENFKTERMTSHEMPMRSNSGRNYWPAGALPPGGGGLRRWGGQ